MPPSSVVEFRIDPAIDDDFILVLLSSMSSQKDQHISRRLAISLAASHMASAFLRDRYSSGSGFEA
jgi:hypothetical protein